MNPAPNATSSSMTRSSRTARRVTASAPRILAAAATSAYSRALNTREQVLLGVAAGILEHFVEQARERLADFRARPHAGRDQVVAAHREILDRERWLLGPDRGHGFLQSLGSPYQQVVREFARLREPAPDARRIARLGGAGAPPARLPRPARPRGASAGRAPHRATRGSCRATCRLPGRARRRGSSISAESATTPDPSR